MSYYKEFWHNILNFNGTASRPAYWWPIIVNYLLGGIIIGIIQHLVGHPIDDIYDWKDLNISMISKIIALVVWIGTLSLKFRRLHDTDRSAWWVLLDLVPPIGTIWFFILTVLPSKPNRWQKYQKMG